MAQFTYTAVLLIKTLKIASLEIITGVCNDCIVNVRLIYDSTGKFSCVIHVKPLLTETPVGFSFSNPKNLRKIFKLF